MTTYNVHIYRELRLVFSGIDAQSHEDAANIARDRPTDDAESIDDCDGETFAALVDVQGDEGHLQSRLVLFEPELRQKSAEKMRIALEAFLEADRLAEECTEWKWENLELAFRLAGEALPGPVKPATILTLTATLAATMREPSPDIVYSPHSLSSGVSDEDVQWTHPDERYVITFHRETSTFTGHYYTWDDEQQDWIDTEPMTAAQILGCIERNHLIFCR